MPKACCAISRTRRMSASGAVTISRRVMSTSSGFGPSSAVGVIGSSAMPQIGQDPGPSRTISGCIGQVHLTPGAAVGAGFGAALTALWPWAAWSCVPWSWPVTGSAFRYFAGSAMNFLRQPSEQK